MFHIQKYDIENRKYCWTYIVILLKSSKLNLNWFDIIWNNIEKMSEWGEGGILPPPTLTTMTSEKSDLRATKQVRINFVYFCNNGYCDIYNISQAIYILLYIHIISIEVDVKKSATILPRVFSQSSITKNLMQNCDITTNINVSENSAKFTTTINSIDGKNAIAAFQNTNSSIFSTKEELRRYVNLKYNVIQYNINIKCGYSLLRRFL